MTLTDRSGRVHRDPRTLLTDHYNLRCTYCMSPEGMPWLPRTIPLILEGLMWIVQIAVEEDTEEVRLTGGGPLLRPDRMDVVAAIISVEPCPETSITTNGIGLARLAEPLKRAGLARVNVSLDTLEPDRFHQFTRRNRLTDVLAGIAAADATGLHPVKLNTLQLRGINDDEAPDLLTFAMDHGYELCFIEQIPLDAGRTWRRNSMVTVAETMARLGEYFTLIPLPGRGAAPAERSLVDDGPATVGIIASMTASFCGVCSRLRLTADGQLCNYLFTTEESDLRTPMREGAGDKKLAGVSHRRLLRKLPGHGTNDPGFLQPQRPMNAIDGQLFTRMRGYHGGV